ncbi:MAG: replication-associated recombination protein A [Kineosporiaceae bacterium]
MSDLFSASMAEPPGVSRSGAAAAGMTRPLAVRMRPRTLDEVVGQQHLLAAGSPLRRLAERSAGPAGPASVLLWGPPGTGKTTLAHIVSRATGRAFVELSAVTAGVKDVRRVMEAARDDRDLHRRETVLFLDEIHRFTKAQQDAVLPGVENRWVILVAATTENPSFSVVAPLLSRSLLLTLQPLTETEVGTLLDRAVADPAGLAGSVRLDPQARAHLVRIAGGDARAALTALEAAAGAALDAAAGTAEAGAGPDGAGDGPDRAGDEPDGAGDESDGAGDEPDGAGDAGDAGDGPVTVGLAVAERAVDRAAVRYDRAGDQHYDVASAFIKSVRGSDVDATLHYLARMLEAGEDPRFVARRLMVSASEDIGTADPSALQVAVAAAQAVQLVGMPEARIILAQAAVHLALAPKSNACYQAIARAVGDIRAGLGGPVPAHLRDGHYPGAARLGHGRGYRYAHDDPRGVVAQQYAPDDLAGRNYYDPTGHGDERELRARLARLRALLRPTSR